MQRIYSAPLQAGLHACKSIALQCCITNLAGVHHARKCEKVPASGLLNRSIAHPPLSDGAEPCIYARSA